MTAFLNWRVWAAIVMTAGLAFTHYTAYKSGKGVIRAAWDAERLEQSEALRRDEKARTIKNQGVDHAYQQKERKRLAAAAATADRLREYEAALASATANPATTSGSDGPFAAIAGECARKLVLLDDHAQKLAGTASALQDYAREVCVMP